MSTNAVRYSGKRSEANDDVLQLFIAHPVEKVFVVEILGQQRGDKAQVIRRILKAELRHRVRPVALEIDCQDRHQSRREITLRELQAMGMTSGINALIVGNYLTTLGRTPSDDLQMLADLKMPIGALSKVI